MSACLKLTTSLCLCCPVHDPSEGEELAGDDDDEDFSIISEASTVQLKTLLGNLQAQLPAPVMQGAWSALSGEAQQALAQL